MKISTTDIIAFFTRLEHMLRADISVHRAFHLMHGKDRVGKIAEHLSGYIDQGKTCAEGLRSLKGISPYVVQLVSIGESHGALSTICGSLRDSLKRKQAFQKHIIGSLVYPCLIIFVALVLLVGMFVFVIPRMLGIFSSMRVTLPLPTRILITSYSLVSSWWWLGFIVFVFLCAGLFVLWRFTRFRVVIETTIIRAPFIGSLVRDISVAQLLHALTLLLNAGLPLRECTEALIPLSPYRVIREALAGISLSIAEGKTLSIGLRMHPYIFSESIIGMIQAGESSGSLATLAEYAADMCEETASEKLRTLSTLVEPLLMIAIGVFTGFIAIALMMPLYEITSSLQIR